MEGAARRWKIALVRDAATEITEREDEDAELARCFDVHQWLEAYLAQEHEELVDELVGVPLS